MSLAAEISRVQIGQGTIPHLPLGFGGWSFGSEQWTGKQDANLLSAMTSALEHGISHFDTATGYGGGYSEKLIGRFIAAEASRRECVFLASKFQSDEISAHVMLNAVDASRDRLQTDVIDLYYIHWPRSNKDMRPWMEGLERARALGKIRAIGVSNLSISQMEQLSEVGRIDAHQLLYNLLWRFNERDIIPYCRSQGIAVVTYSSIAHGILAGSYARELDIPAGDQRRDILLFRTDIWPRIYEIVEDLKQVAKRAERPLIHLAIRWLLHQQGVKAVIVGAVDAQQAISNSASLQDDIADDIFDELTTISQRAITHIPDVGNPYGYHP